MLKRLLSAAARAALAVILATTGAARGEDSVLARLVDVDVAAQPLGEALIALARQSGTQISVGSDSVDGRVAPAIRGKMSLGDALGKLLEGTGLEARPNGPNAIGIGPIRSSVDDVHAAVSPLAVAPIARGAAASAPGVPASPGLEEIIVTANRRAENLQDVASGIRVLAGQELERSGATRFEDYVFTVPGLDLADSGLEKKIAIRGIGNIAGTGVAAGGSTSPVGIYLDDTPIQGNGILPDLDLYDLERIEVLKGPQGTLYGEGAQGGAIKMLLNKADPSTFAAKGETGVGETYNGHGLNNFQKLAVNVPIIDGRFAVRLVGSRKWDSGFVDYFRIPDEHANDATNLMGRIHVYGKLWDAFEARAMLFHERQRLDQFPQVQKAEGDLRNKNKEPQFSDTDFTLAGLTLDYDLGFAELTNTTSGFINDRQMLARYPFVGPLAFVFLSPIVGGGIGQIPGPNKEWITTDNHQFSIAEELRLVSREPFRLGVDWLAFNWVTGFFYRKRENNFDYVVDNDAPCCPPPALSGFVNPFGVERFEQFAGFGEVTIDLPWRLKFDSGVRVFRETALLAGSGRFRGPLYFVIVANGEPDGEIGPTRYETATTEVAPKFSLAWSIDDSHMLYGLIANGVRSGGTNLNSLFSTVTPLFSPDSLWTFEVGAKTSWLDGNLVANLSLFHNEWKDLQVLTTEVATLAGVPVAGAVILNVGQAFSRGAELELLYSVPPIAGLRLGFNLAILDGEITKGDEAGTVPDHTPLPQLSKVAYAASMAYDPPGWSLAGFAPFMRFDTQRVGHRFMAPPGGTIPAPEMDSFHLYGVMVGLANEQWDVSFAVRNLTDTRPELAGNAFELGTKTIGSPRTWTAKVGFHF